MILINKGRGSWRRKPEFLENVKIGVFYLTNRWSDLNEIWFLGGIHVSELLFQFPTRSFDIRGSWRGKSWKTLRVEESGWRSVDRISKCLWYVIGVTVLDSLSLGELEGWVQWFGEFCASGRARTMKIGRRVRELHKGFYKVVSPDPSIWGTKGRGIIRKNEAFVTYEWVIGS